MSAAVMMSFRWLLIISLLLIVGTGCWGSSGTYTRSVYGTAGGYSMANAHAKPATLMVAKKIEEPLYIVLDPARLKSTWRLETTECATGGKRCERFNLLDVHLFVRRDLKAAMENYFSRVEVVDSTAALPQTPHVVADVKIDNIRLNPLVRGMLTHVLIEMTWGFAMRKHGEDEYRYSFAGTATSQDSYPTFEAGLAQLVENAIPTMLKKWTESDAGMQAFQASATAPQ